MAYRNGHVYLTHLSAALALSGEPCSLPRVAVLQAALIFLEPAGYQNAILLMEMAKLRQEETTAKRLASFPRCLAICSLAEVDHVVQLGLQLKSGVGECALPT